MHRHTRTYLFIVDKHMIQLKRNKQKHFPYRDFSFGEYIWENQTIIFPGRNWEKGNWMNHRRIRRRRETWIDMCRRFLFSIIYSDLSNSLEIFMNSNGGKQTEKA